jgi:hypothetical protein
MSLVDAGSREKSAIDRPSSVQMIWTIARRELVGVRAIVGGVLGDFANAAEAVQSRLDLRVLRERAAAAVRRGSDRLLHGDDVANAAALRADLVEGAVGDDGQDIRADIFRLIADKGWVLLELHRDTQTLEDVFRQLTIGDERRNRQLGPVTESRAADEEEEDDEDEDEDEDDDESDDDDDSDDEPADAKRGKR